MDEETLVARKVPEARLFSVERRLFIRLNYISYNVSAEN